MKLTTDNKQGMYSPSMKLSQSTNWQKVNYITHFQWQVPHVMKHMCKKKYKG